MNRLRWGKDSSATRPHLIVNLDDCRDLKVALLRLHACATGRYAMTASRNSAIGNTNTNTNPEILKPHRILLNYVAAALLHKYLQVKCIGSDFTGTEWQNGV
jgi:hypothetical protein